MILAKLAEIMEAKGWTNQKLADESGVPLSSITRIRNGQTDNPSIQHVIDMANALGVSVEELTGIKQVEQKYSPDDNLIQLYKDMIRTKDKYIKWLAIALISILVVLVGLLCVDLMIHDIGYFRY